MAVDIKLNIIMQFSGANADVVKQQISDITDYLQKLGIQYNVLQQQAQQSGKAQSSFTEFLENISGSLQSFYAKLGSEDIWTKVFGKFDTKQRSNFMDYLWVTADTYSKNIEKLWQTTAQSLEQYGASMAKSNIANMENQLRAYQGTLKQSQIDTANNLQQQTEQMREIVLQALAKIGIGAYTKGNEMAQNYMKGVSDVLSGLGERDWNIIYERYFTKRMDLSQLISGEIPAIDFDELVNEAEKYVEEYKALVEQFGTDTEKIYEELGTKQDEYARRGGSALAEMGIQMWFLSIAIRQVEESLKMYYAQNDIVLAQLELVSNALNSLTYGWFGLTKMIEMYMQKMMITPQMTADMVNALKASIGKTATIIAAIISLIIAIIPVITQWQNKIDEGFIKLIDRLSEYKDISTRIFDAKDMLDWLSALTEFEKEYGKILKGIDITKLKPEELEIVIKPIFEEYAIKEFMKSGAGGKALTEMLGELDMSEIMEKMTYHLAHPGWLEKLIMLVSPEPFKQFFENTKKEAEGDFVPFMKKQYEEIAHAEKEQTDKMTYYWTQYEEAVKEKLKGTTEEVKTYSDIELEIRRKTAEVAGDTELEFQLKLEQKKRELQREGIYTQEEVDAIINLEIQQHNQEIAQSEKELQAKILDLQGKTHEAFMLNLEIEVDALRRSGIDEALIEQYKAEQIKAHYREIWEAQQDFYMELATLRGEDDKAFAMSLEMQKRQFQELGISAVDIKEWETLKWKEYEEQKTEKLKQEEENRLNVYNNFLKSYLRLKGMEVEARKIEWGEMVAGWEEAGIMPQIAPEQLEEYKNLYIYEDKYRMLEDFESQYRELTSETSQYEIDELRRRVDEYEKAGGEKVEIEKFINAKLKDIWQKGSNEYINQLKSRIEELKSASDKEIQEAERVRDAQKDLYIDILGLKMGEGFDKDLLELILKRDELLKQTQDIGAVNEWFMLNATDLVEKYNKELEENYQKTLERIEDLNKDLSNNIKKLTLDSFDYELYLLQERTNEYIKSGADILLVEQNYYLEAKKLHDDAVKDWIDKEMEKYDNAIDLAEKIKSFQEKQMGIEKPKPIQEYEQTVAEAKALIRQIWGTEDLSLEEKEDLINRVISSINLDEYGKGLTARAIKDVTGYVDTIKKIEASVPEFKIPEFGEIVREKPPELKPPELITWEDVEEKIKNIDKQLAEIDKIVTERFDNTVNEINKKLIEGILNDPTINEILTKFLGLQNVVLSEIDWYGLGVNIGDLIGEGVLKSFIDIIKDITGLEIPEVEITPIPPIIPGAKAGTSTGLKTIAGAGYIKPTPIEPTTGTEILSILSGGKAGLPPITDIYNFVKGQLEKYFKTTINTSDSIKDILNDAYRSILKNKQEPTPGVDTYDVIIKQLETSDIVLDTFYTIKDYIDEAYKNLPKEGEKLISSDFFKNIGYEEAGWHNVIAQQYLPTYIGGTNVGEESYRLYKEEELEQRLDYYESLRNILPPEKKPSGNNIEVKVYIGNKEIEQYVTSIIEKEMKARSV